MKPATPTTDQPQNPTERADARTVGDTQDPNDLFEQAQAVQIGAQAILVHPFVKNTVSRRSPESALEELVSLSGAIDLHIIDQQICSLPSIRPSTYMGQGKIDELAAQVRAQHVDVVVVNATLSPVQQRNLERALGTKVIDRTALILEIFGARAQTREGVMQVELAHLSYQRGRLVRSWTHLERQRGGAGFMGGPGERQIEADRRLLDERIGRLTRQLEKVTRTRDLHRKGRKKIPYPIVALVGYTNAGKSTLFNHLTEADVYAQDQLFATLDPTMRGITLPSGRQIILSDTVGFISDLPTHLVAAFRATLEEVVQADIIIHVRDIAHPETDEQREDVLDVLNDLGIKEYGDQDIIEIHNKIDLLDHDVDTDPAHHRDKAPIPFCALDGRGEDILYERIDQILARDARELTISLRHDQGEIISWLYRHSDVLERTDHDDGCNLQVRVSPEALGRLQKMDGVEIVSSATAH